MIAPKTRWVIRFVDPHNQRFELIATTEVAIYVSNLPYIRAVQQQLGIKDSFYVLTDPRYDFQEVMDDLKKELEIESQVVLEEEEDYGD